MQQVTGSPVAGPDGFWLDLAALTPDLPAKLVRQQVHVPARSPSVRSATTTFRSLSCARKRLSALAGDMEIAPGRP